MVIYEDYLVQTLDKKIPRTKRGTLSQTVEAA